MGPRARAVNQSILKPFRRARADPSWKGSVQKVRFKQNFLELGYVWKTIIKASPGLLTSNNGALGTVLVANASK